MADQRTHKRKQTVHEPDQIPLKEKVAIGCLYVLLAVAAVMMYFSLR